MIILGVGSNVGDRAAHLSAAVRALSGFMTDMRTSRTYESAALLPPDAPESWDIPYLNMVVCGECAFSPEALLQAAKRIEIAGGRQARGKWGPREIDVDILAMGDLVVETPGLTLPHPEMLERDFVLLPLAEIIPGWCYPGNGPYHNIPIGGIIAAQGFSLGRGLRIYG